MLSLLLLLAMHNVQIHWTPSVTPNVTYNLYRGASATGLCVAANLYQTGLTGHSYVDGIADGELFVYTLQSVDADGNTSNCASPGVRVNCRKSPCAVWKVKIQ